MSEASNDRVIIPPEEAKQMLPDKEEIHTFRNSGSILIGADWSRADMLEAIDSFPVELSGDMATSMHHGLVLKDAGGWLFIETKPK